MIFTLTCACPICSCWRTARYLQFRQTMGSEEARARAAEVDSAELWADTQSLHTIHDYYGQMFAVPSPNLENDWRPLTDWSPDLGQGMLIEELLDESTLQWLEKMKEKK